MLSRVCENTKFCVYADSAKVNINPTIQYIIIGEFESKNDKGIITFYP